MTERHHSICRACTASCPVIAEVRDGRVVRVDADKSRDAASVYHGYACQKGRGVPEFMYSPTRLMTSMKQLSDGSHEPIESGRAMREAADRLAAIRRKYGNRSIALYVGTFGFNHGLSGAAARAFMNALDLPMQFNTSTIDQPGKGVADAVHGCWLAGPASPQDADAILLIGFNPIISMLGPPNPAYVLNEARKRKAALLVIDPRRTEVAALADLHLQPRPGTDALILAALARVIIAEQLYDQDFLAENVRGFEALAKAVEPCSVAFVAERAGVREADIVAMARRFAAARRGLIQIGTGPNMAGDCCLVEYLGRCLMTLCGHWSRAGDLRRNPGVLIHRLPALAQAADPVPGWGFGQRMRLHGLTETPMGLPTALLPDEILLEGEGQVRALIVQGGNPAMAFPDQIKTIRALESLELLITVDPEMSETAELADYVFAPRVHFETHGESSAMELISGAPFEGFQHGYAHLCRPVVEPPPRSDLLEDWEFYYGMAQHLGIALTIKPLSWAMQPDAAMANSTTLDMVDKPGTEDVLAALFKGGPAPWDELRRSGNAPLVRPGDVPIAPKAKGFEGRLDIGNPDILGSLDDALAQSDADPAFPLRLISRRLKNRYNSSWRHHSVSHRRGSHNPAFVNPADLDTLGLRDGDLVEVASARSSIQGVIEAAPDVRTGTVSMPHCWDDSTSRLVDSGRNVDRWTGIPRMSAIPVRLKLLQRAEGAAPLAAPGEEG